jgi:hypothetical protein
LVKIGAEAEGQAVDVMEINRPDDLGDIADLGLTLAETKRLLARLQQHAARRPTCSRGGDGAMSPAVGETSLTSGRRATVPIAAWAACATNSSMT